jgi:TetR/AcrR family transcriptional regulator, mexJK operon transcriptional repressor
MTRTKSALKLDRREPREEVLAVVDNAVAEELSPRALQRRQEILDAATELFLEKGFSGYSIDDIIKRTGGSKRTIYKLFPCKQDLFGAITQVVVQKILEPIEIPALGERPIEDVLREFGENYIAVKTTSEFSKLYRGILTEAVRFPETCRCVFEAGPARVNAALAEVLAHYEARGDVTFTNRELAAEQFIAMLRTERMLAASLGIEPQPNKAAIRRHVANTVTIFLDGCRKRG